MRSASGQMITVRNLGLQPYQRVASRMATLIDRPVKTGEHAIADEIWLLQHEPVYTQGTACTQSVLQASTIPVVKSDRGGQITYHGPGQLVVYPLLTLRRYRLTVKSLVNLLEQAVIDLLAELGLDAQRRDGAPGVYVADEKIAQLGLRIRRGRSYHGLSLNVAMDLTPFDNIDPCGFTGLRVTQLRELLPPNEVDFDLLSELLLTQLLRRL
ncbi:MAG: lipoyl(octanoyl) transferase LipB [Gammaproteobacteria bacterium]|nr:lipoyl(octanoyl) transferase LipB [Gammaproteobacteria bacterium]